MGAIEDIALDLIGGVQGGNPDGRLTELRPYLATDYIEDAARLILDHPGHAMIITGFFIPQPYVHPLPDTGTVETDGPPGAYFLGQALRKLDYEVTYVSDRWCTFVFEDVEDYVEFPITGFTESEEFAKRLLEDKSPSVVIATERCGVTRERRYLNIRRWDISEFTGKLDALMDNHPHTVGIGDAGNEMGMGNFAPYIEEIQHPLIEPTVTRSARPVLGRSSDWGAYGLVAGLSKLAGRDVLPTAKEVQEFIVRIVDKGVVTGSGRKKYEVDGRSLDQQAELLGALRDALKRSGVEVQGG